MDKAFKSLKLAMTTTSVLMYIYFDKPFIVEKVAPRVDFVAISEQNGDGEKVHPIQCANRTMTKAKNIMTAASRNSRQLYLAFGSIPCISCRRSHLLL